MKTLLDKEELVSNPPQLGCVLSLPGLPGGGSKTYDRGPYGNIGAITGATWARLPSGLWCLSFDGNDDYVNCGSDGSLRPSAVTFELWLKTHSLASTQFLNALSVTGTGGYQLIYRDADHKLRWHIAESDSAWKFYVNTDDGIEVDKWYHVVALYESGRGELYLNGDRQSDVSTATGDIYYDVAPLLLGTSHSYGFDFNGLIALVRTYNRALSALEIQNHFNQEKYLFGAW